MTAQLHESISALEALDPAALSDTELHRLVIELEGVDSRLALVRATVSSAWDARKLWADDGSKAGWGWLTRHCHLTAGTAKREMGRARKLRTMPATVAAVQAGKLSIEQADLLRTANRPELAELFADAEPMLVDDIATLRLDDAKRAVDYWIDAAYDQIDQDRPYRTRDGRYVTAVRTFGGTVDVRGRLDPLAGTELLTELHRIEQRLFAADWAEARAEHGPDALPKHLPRTAFQRMADSLVIMARQSSGYRDGIHHQPAPLITIHVGCGTFSRMCELADGTVIAPGQAVPYLTEGDIERIVFAGPSRVLDVGVRQHFFTGALRRAIEVRDRRCTHPSCDVLAEHCHIDHIVRYTDGGLTIQDNGRCGCPVHNRQRERKQHPRPPPDDTS